MPFFQNLFNSSFEGFLLLNDQQFNATFRVPNNYGRGMTEVQTYGKAPFNLSGNDSSSNPKSNLRIKYSMYNSPNWMDLDINLTSGVGSTSAVTVHEIVNILNGNATFAGWFSASVKNGDSILISQKKPIDQFRFYIDNRQAETVLKFNALSGIAEMPTYFSRHTFENALNYPDSVGLLVKLDLSNDDHKALIENAVDVKGKNLGYDPDSPKEDWELLKGCTSLFQFTKGSSAKTVDEEKETLIYNAGAVAGDLAKKIIEKYDEDGELIAKFEIPYTLDENDLITP